MSPSSCPIINLDAMPFKEIFNWMQSKDLIHLLPAVAKLGWQAFELRAVDRRVLEQHSWLPGDIDILLNSIYDTQPMTTPGNIPLPRRDFPRRETRSRGPIKRALSAALPNCRRESIGGALEDDFYANSSKPSQASYYNTWSRLATAWHMPPIPITRKLLLAVGASMKHAGYRSPQNYSYKAAQVHRECLEQELPAHLHQLMQKIIRSIKRGQGPTPFKDSFDLELFHIPLEKRNMPRQGHWFNDHFASRDITIIACWWMLRGIEAAAVKLQHIWYHETNVTKFAYFTLPVQKNDPAGQCVSRGRPCIW